ncbi:MAG TPA: YigZ family protein [Lachnospiraceae bacterium]|nr:YigZ family protein [Lachnospiraceae bacterium]
MVESYRAVYSAGDGEIIEKKSRFLASVQPVESEEEALNYIEQVKKKHWGATHNCYAYVIGKMNQIQRYSDDGEPGGTAGKPMLEVLLSKSIHNTVVVVTRYFGGTLLGTGGLVRAYTNAAIEGLNNSIIIDKVAGEKIIITTDYNGIGKIQYIACQMQITVLDTVYTDIVSMELLVPLALVSSFSKEITQATSGRASIEEHGKFYFAKLNEEIITFNEMVE